MMRSGQPTAERQPLREHCTPSNTFTGFSVNKTVRISGSANTRTSTEIRMVIIRSRSASAKARPIYPAGSEFQNGDPDGQSPLDKSSADSTFPSEFSNKTESVRVLATYPSGIPEIRNGNRASKFFITAGSKKYIQPKSSFGSR